MALSEIEKLKLQKEYEESLKVSQSFLEGINQLIDNSAKSQVKLTKGEIEFTKQLKSNLEDLKDKDDIYAALIENEREFNKLASDGRRTEKGSLKTAREDLKLAGYHALNSLRTEKGYLHWGHDITVEENPYEAGVGFCVNMEKDNFLGKKALKDRIKTVPSKRKINLSLSDNNLLLYHNEPIFFDGEYFGSVARIPQEGNLKANFHAGGKASKTDLVYRDQEIIKNLGPKLKEHNLFFVGIDTVSYTHLPLPTKA